MCYNYTGSKFRLSMPYFSVGIIFSKHSIAHQGRTQDFSKGVSKEGIAKAISTAHFVPACAWCAQAPCSEKSVTLRGVSRNSGNPPVYTSAHPLQGLGDFQDRVIIVLSMHTPTEYQCLGTVQAQKAICTYVTLWGIDVMTLVEHS